MKFGFERLVCQFPEQRTSVETLVQEAQLGEEYIERLHTGGIHEVPTSNDMPLPSLINQAVRHISALIPRLGKRTGVVIYAHSMPLLSPADVPFLERCLEGRDYACVPRLAISGQPCAILHQSVKLAGHWLARLPADKGVLLIGADKAYRAKDRLFFGSAMGDVAVVGFLTRDALHDQVLASVIHSDIICCDGERSPEADIARFRQLNTAYIRHAIEMCVANGGIELRDLKYIVPHTPYTSIWDTVSTLLRFPRDRILSDYIGQTGHLNSNDSFAHYIRALEEGRIQNGDHVLLVNPGFGGTRGCTLIRH